VYLAPDTDDLHCSDCLGLPAPIGHHITRMRILEPVGSPADSDNDNGTSRKNGAQANGASDFWYINIF
jgi:hypothetical protein